MIVIHDVLKTKRKLCENLDRQTENEYIIVVVGNKYSLLRTSVSACWICHGSNEFANGILLFFSLIMCLAFNWFLLCTGNVVLLNFYYYTIDWLLWSSSIPSDNFTNVNMAVSCIQHCCQLIFGIGIPTRHFDNRSSINRWRF